VFGSAPKDHVVLGLENISGAELISLVNIQVPGVLSVDASVPRTFGVIIIMCFDLCRVYDILLKCLIKLSRKSPL
jgi:hypothetical protein